MWGGPTQLEIPVGAKHRRPLPPRNHRLVIERNVHFGGLLND